MNTDTAVQYEQIIQRRGYRPSASRLKLLETLCILNEPTDAAAVTNRMTQEGQTADTESIRLHLKRLGEAGVLLRFPQAGKNKYLVQLRPLDELEEEDRNNFNINSQAII